MTLPVLAVSDVIWQALIAAAVTIILAYMQSRTKNAVDSNHQETAAKMDAIHNAVVNPPPASCPPDQGKLP